MTAALLALCACGAAVPAVLESDTPPETSVSPSAEASETPTPEPTDTPTPTPPATPEPTEEPTPSPEPVPDSPLPSWEALQRTLYETNAYCAALYLGRSGAASLSDALPELLAQKGLDGISYLADIAASACVEQPGDEVFILSVQGESMIEAGILDGDFVIVRRQSHAENGDIVVAMIDDEATVKRIFYEKTRVRLQPENSAMQPIYARDVTVLGRVIALFRQM